MNQQHITGLTTYELKRGNVYLHQKRYLIVEVIGQKRKRKNGFGIKVQKSMAQNQVGMMRKIMVKP